MAANFTENDFKLMKDGGEQGEKTIQEFFNDVERFSNNCRRIFKNTKTKIYWRRIFIFNERHNG